MMLLAAVCVLALLSAASDAGATRLRVHAKLLAHAHAATPLGAHTVHAWSPSHCLARCSKKVGCDAVNYFKPSGRCALIPRCARTALGFTSDDYYFYSKRPQILTGGFHYDPATGSCIKVSRAKADYAQADRACAQENGRLVALKSPSSNELARSLLRTSGAQFAWIGLLDLGREGNPTHSDGSRALDSNFFKPATHRWQNSTQKNCWALQDDGLWAELSCKTRRLYSICEVPLF